MPSKVRFFVKKMKMQLNNMILAIKPIIVLVLIYIKMCVEFLEYQLFHSK